MNLSKLSASKLQALTAKRGDALSALTSQLIQAGYGRERASETRSRAAETGDALALAYVRAMDEAQACYDEESARKRYQGNLNPIKRSA